MIQTSSTCDWDSKKNYHRKKNTRTSLLYDQFFLPRAAANRVENYRKHRLS